MADSSAAVRPSLAQRFGWVSLFQDLGSKMVVPLVPLVLLEIGAGPLAIGLVDAVAASVVVLVAPIAGRLQAIRAMPMVRLGYSLSSLSKLALVATGSVGTVLAVRVVDRIGKGVRDGPRDELLAASAPSAPGRAFGLHQAMDKFGGFLGPVLGWALIELAGWSLDQVIIVAFVPCAISVALLLLPGYPSVETSTSTSERTTDGRPYWPALATVGLVSIGSFPLALLILRTVELELGFSGALGGYALYRLAAAVVAAPIGRLADRHGAGTSLAASAAITGAGAAMALGTSVIALASSFALLGVAESSGRVGAKSWIATVAGPEFRRKALSDRVAVQAASGVAGGALYGVLFGDDGEFALTVAIAISIVALGVVLRHTVRHAEH